MANLEGGVFIVTGGASLIGIAVVRRLVEAGGRVVVTDMAAEPDPALLPHGDAVTYLAGDIVDNSFLDRVVTTAGDRYDRLDGVVTAAATFRDGRLETTREDWLKALDVNLVSAAMLTARASSLIAKSDGGSIVYIASISGHRAQPDRMVYPVTKAALLMLARTAAVQLAPEKIRVNTVSPGWTWSRNMQKRYGSRERADALAAEFQSLGRMAEPDEIAAAVTFLLSDDAAFITGTDIAVDGGYTALGPEALGQPQRKFPVA